MKIYLTRHGETEFNKEGRMQGWQNSNLSSKGVENAINLGKHLSPIDFDAIYCSPLGRAMETAKHIKGNREIDIIPIENLKEMAFGVWEGMLHSEIQEIYPEEHHHFWQQPHLYRRLDGESYEELIERVKKGLDEIINEAAGENILVVAHAAVIKAIYAIIKNIPLEDFWRPPFIKDTCLSIIEVEGQEMKFLIEADVSHVIVG